MELLHAWRIEGVFDPASEGPAKLDRALRTLAAGHSYWSAGLAAQLLATTRRAKERGHVLSPAELVVLGAIGDGCDNETAAQRLGRAVGTIGTVRRNLYRKLGLRHKGELVEYAAQHGFVRFSRGGVVRPGFQPQRAAYETKRARAKRGAAGAAMAAA